MPIARGTRLGPYEVESLLGQGGMGEVYQARDTHLDRSVALKVLPDSFAADADRRSRFEREAKTLAALNHPHIAQIYGLEKGAGVLALAMELVDGEELAARITRGPIPVAEACALARQIAEALEAAHDAGIVHRDLKPANVKLRADGTIKVLDFGLAKPMGGNNAESRVNSPTFTSPAMTAAGIILGTAAYMSPEQARGFGVDKRTDVWAFGCVLFEMLTGRPAFPGHTVTDMLAAIVRQEPDWSLLPRDVPTNVVTMLHRCLRKDVRQRLHDIADARLELEEPAVNPADVNTPLAPGWGLTLPWAVVTLLLIAATYVVGTQRVAETPAAIATDWLGELVGGPPVAFGPRVSPDGQTVAFLAMVDGVTQPAILRRGTGYWTLLASDRDQGITNTVAWSADGASVYYDRTIDTPRGIYRVPAIGGVSRLVLDSAMAPEPLPDGSLLAVRLNQAGANEGVQFFSSTGQVRVLTSTFARGAFYPLFRAMPGGREVLFFGRTDTTPDARDQLVALDLQSAVTRAVAPAGVVDYIEPFAISRDGRFAVIDDSNGAFHRLAMVATDGSARRYGVFSVTGRPFAIDVAPDGSIYADLTDHSSHLLSSKGGAPTTRIALPRSAYLTERLLTLPDGRVLIPTLASGRSVVMAFTVDGRSAPFVESDEQTAGPLAMFGADQVALVQGTRPKSTVSFVSVDDGRVVGRVDGLSPENLTGLLGSRDKTILYYVAEGALWGRNMKTGAVTKLHAADGGALHPNGSEAMVAVTDQQGGRLFRVALPTGVATEVQYDHNYRFEATFTFGAIAPDGRVALRLTPRDSWFWPIAILDPNSGKFTPAWPDVLADQFTGGWTQDGRLMGAAFSTNSSLWRFWQRSDSPDQTPGR